MRQFLVVLDDVLPFASAVLPWVLAVFAVAAVVRTRWCGVPPALAVGASFVDAVLVHSSMLITYLVAVPQPDSGTALRWALGSDLLEAVRAAPGDLWPWLQLLGNLGLIFPLGALLPLRVRWLTSFRMIALGALAVTCTIEIAQCTVIAGRVTSADDIVLNTTGAVFGGLFSRRCWGELCGLPRAPQVAGESARYRPAVSR